MRTVRLTRQLSLKELQVAIACGARDERDYIIYRHGRRGCTVELEPSTEWPGDKTLRYVEMEDGKVWLFEPIEDGKRDDAV